MNANNSPFHHWGELLVPGIFLQHLITSRRRGVSCLSQACRTYFCTILCWLMKTEGIAGCDFPQIQWGVMRRWPYLVFNFCFDEYVGAGHLHNVYRLEEDKFIRNIGRWFTSSAAHSEQHGTAPWVLDGRMLRRTSSSSHLHPWPLPSSIAHSVTQTTSV